MWKMHREGVAAIAALICVVLFFSWLVTTKTPERRRGSSDLNQKQSEKMEVADQLKLVKSGQEVIHFIVNDAQFSKGLTVSFDGDPRGGETKLIIETFEDEADCDAFFDRLGIAGKDSVFPEVKVVIRGIYNESDGPHFGQKSREISFGGIRK